MGFTLIELLVVIALLGILAALLLPVLSRSRQKVQGVYCLNNGHQMMVALTLYGAENNDCFPPNPDDGNTVLGHNWCGGRAGVGMAQEFNPDILKDPNRCLVASYLKGNVSVFHCPGDKRAGLYQGTDPALLGRTVPAARSFSMSQAVGTLCPGFDAGAATGTRRPHRGAPTLAVNGPWLDGSSHHIRDSPWFTYGKFSNIRAPGPARLWVLVDEDVRNLNDAAFSFQMERSAWLDVPGTYHYGFQPRQAWREGRTKDGECQRTGVSPDQYHEVRLGANARINALAAWRLFQRAMSRPRLHATSTAKSISGARHARECDTPLLPPCQRQRPVSPGRVPLAQLAVLINAPAR